MSESHQIGSEQTLGVSFVAAPNDFGPFGPIRLWIGGHAVGRTDEEHFLYPILQMLEDAVALGAKDDATLRHVPSTEFMDGYTLEVARDGDRLKFQWTDPDDVVTQAAVSLEGVRAAVREFRRVLESMGPGPTRTH